MAELIGTKWLILEISPNYWLANVLETTYLPDTLIQHTNTHIHKQESTFAHLETALGFISACPYTDTPAYVF